MTPITVQVESLTLAEIKDLSVNSAFESEAYARRVEEAVSAKWHKAIEGLAANWVSKSETIRTINGLIEAKAAVPPDHVVVTKDLIRRAQQAINYHLEPNSPDEHEKTMVELRAIGWPEEEAWIKACIGEVSTHCLEVKPSPGCRYKEAGGGVCIHCTLKGTIEETGRYMK